MTEKETEKQAIQRFAEVMNVKMSERRARYKPFGWRDPKYKSLQDLTTHLDEEIEEYQQADEIEDVMSELVDVANTTFMLWDRLRLNNTPKT